jgi:serine protease AprX
MKKNIIFAFLIVFSGSLFAQVKYWVFFKDKPLAQQQMASPNMYLSEKSLQRRSAHEIPLHSSDMPVHQPYIQTISNAGVFVLRKSKWLNAVSVFATQQQIEEIQKLSFIDDVKPVKKMVRQAEQISDQQIVSTATYSYGNSLNQIAMMNGNVLHDAGSVGQGMTIAVLDGGFTGANWFQPFDTLWNDGRVIAAYDFNDGDTNVFERGSHGTAVLSVMAAFVDGQLIGTAPKANYMLLQSENQSSETTIEEDNWVRAAEFADSAGADIINSSLGYYTFDGGIGDYTYSDLDGRTATTTLAAVMAARKGILVVNSAGNEGGSSWNYIITPADADSILAVGGVDEFENHVGFSSRGPTADGRIKPDVSAKALGVTVVNGFGNITAGNGTSFAAPLITGLAACLWQRHPSRTAMQVRDAIIESASQYQNPDTLLGYGIPDFAIADQILSVLGDSEVEVAPSNVSLFPNPFSQELSLRIDLTQISSQAEITVLNYTGQIVAQQSIPLENRITQLRGFETLPSGLYVFNILIGKQVYSFKMMR